MPLKTPITVALARFEDLLGKGLRQVIETDPGLQVVAAEVDHRRLPVVFQAHTPDVAILDAGALAQLAEVRELTSEHPATKLILLARQVGVGPGLTHARSIYRELGFSSRRELAEPPRRIPGPEIGSPGLAQQDRAASLIVRSWPAGA